MLVAIVLLASALYLTIQRLHIALFSPVSWTPGPLFCKLTDLPAFWAAFNRRHGQWLQSLHHQYGDVVRIGPNRFSISDPKVIPKIYDGKNEFCKSEKMAVMHNVVNGKVVPGMVSTNDKTLHASIRMPVAALYSMSNVLSYESQVDSTITSLVGRLSDAYVETKRPCEFAKWAQYLLGSTDTITAITTGKPMGFLQHGGDVSNMLSQFKRTQRYRSLVIHIPWLDWLLVKNPIRRRFAASTVLLMQRARALVLPRMQCKPASEISAPRDFLGQLLEVHERRPEQVPARRIMAYVGVNLQAGSDTTAIHLRSVVYHVLKSQGGEVARRLQEELDAADLQYPASYREASKLPYLDAVIKEAQRMFHVGAGIMERVVPPGGLELSNGRVLPEGAGVGISGLTVQFDRTVFGADADVFNPDRWLRGANETEGTFAERLSAMRAADMTWGRGSRTCLGKNIAMLELCKVVATMFGVFDMELANPDRKWRIEENFFRTQHGIEVNVAWRPGKSLNSLRPREA